MNEMKFKSTGMGNEILDVSKDCFISFNQCVDGLGIGFEADGNSPETAIVIKVKRQNVYKILNGDFRNECLNLLKKGKGEKELLELYMKNKDKHSSWSNK